MLRWLAVASAVGLLASASRTQADVVIPTTGTWHVSSRARVAACALGQCAATATHDERDVVLAAGLVVRTEIRVSTCDGIQLEDFGDFVPVKPGVAKLRHVDRAGMEQVLRQCSSFPSLRVQQVTGREVVPPDGQSFRTKLRLALTIRRKGQTAGVTITFRLQGQRTGDATPTSRAAGAVPADGAVPRPAAPVDATIDAVLAR